MIEKIILFGFKWGTWTLLWAAHTLKFHPYCHCDGIFSLLDGRCESSKNLARHGQPKLIKIVGIVSGMTAATKYT